MNIYYETLNGSRLSLLKKLVSLKEEFYLAGGTGLALQIGHLISEVFDFFTDQPFENETLFNRLKKFLTEFSLKIIQNEENTMTIMINHEIKCSFFKLEYKNILPLVITDFIRIAQIKEIGVMKLAALTRAVFKDYVDIYFILKENLLKDLILLAKKKHPELDESIYIKCLLSYHDIEKIPVIFMPGKDVPPQEIFNFIEANTVKFIGEKN